jgi:hypothetical protein
MGIRCEHFWIKKESGWMCKDCEMDITENEFRARMALYKIVSEFEAMQNESDNSELFNAINEAADFLKYT